MLSSCVQLCTLCQFDELPFLTGHANRVCVSILVSHSSMLRPLSHSLSSSLRLSVSLFSRFLASGVLLAPFAGCFHCSPFCAGFPLRLSAEVGGHDMPCLPIHHAAALPQSGMHACLCASHAYTHALPLWRMTMQSERQMLLVKFSEILLTMPILVRFTPHTSHFHLSRLSVFTFLPSSSLSSISFPVSFFFFHTLLVPLSLPHSVLCVRQWTTSGYASYADTWAAARIWATTRRCTSRARGTRFLLTWKRGACGTSCVMATCTG